MRPPSSLPGSIKHLLPILVIGLGPTRNRYRPDSTFSVLLADILVNSLHGPVCEGTNVAFTNPFKRKPSPLTGAPALRRMKTYSAQTGYVYQYYYQGHRPFRSGSESGVEFVFEISSDRKTWNQIAVRAADSAIRPWEEAHARELSSTERYAVAKMALFQAFDERPVSQMKDEIIVRHADLQLILETLDL
jgi:hypothetical protein